MPRKKTNRFEVPREVRKLARERVGAVPSSRPLTGRQDRKKPKHKRPPGEDPEV